MPLEIDRYQVLIEKEIKNKKYGKTPASLYEPIGYLMSLGGKRLRPMLTLLSYSLYKKDIETVVPSAIAVEVFHNFTLMHDDIMDKAPLRRGKPTVHEKWNVNTAILSGDVMQVKVYEILNKLEANTFKVVSREFNNCAIEVCEGQQWDMEFETTDKVTEAQYLNMIRLKTAVLLGFCLEYGAILAGASEEDRKLLYAFGTNIGIGFQLKDDLLDAYADPKKFGKQVGGDIISNKKTWLLIKALEKAKGKQRRELLSLLKATRFNKNEKVKAVKAIYDSLNIPALANKKIDQYFAKGFADLEKLSVDTSSKAVLKNFTESLIQRQS
jgi:geranylgeranyl diphosphate synthase, type II